MLEFAEITINDKELFGKYLRLDNPQISDTSFTNLFMWRDYYKFRYAEIHGMLWIISVPEGQEPFLLEPIGNMNQESIDRAIVVLKEYFKKNDWKLVFKKIHEDKIQYFRKHVNSEESIVFDRDNSDYVYLSDNLINLKGKKYDGKRNHINKFKKLYQYEYVPLTEEHINDCSDIMDAWCRERNCDDHKGFYCEKLANMEVLKNFNRLGCKGAIMRVDGKFEGFTIGEMLNADTAVIHIEKANNQVNGLYTFINQQFCEHEWQQAKYINREQDLGVEGLRKAKLSYNPEKLINKYTIYIA